MSVVDVIEESSDSAASQLEYWRRALADPPSPLELPADKPRTSEQAYARGTVSLRIPQGLSDSLRALTRRESVSTFVVCLSAWQLLLYRYSGQSDVLVGAPPGRGSSRGADAPSGSPRNTLVLRARISDDMTFRDLLSQVRRTASDAFANDGIPLEHIVQVLRPASEVGGAPPYFRNLFVLQPAASESNGQHDPKSQFDSTLSIRDEKSSLTGAIEYREDLFERVSAERLAANYVELLSVALADPSTKISEISIVADAERRLLIDTWNPPATAYPRAKCTHQLFEERVGEQPNATAVIADDRTLSYLELNQRADALASRLRDAGVGRDTLVGVCLDRSSSLVVALLAVWKAGGAYVPLDAHFPNDRLAYMLEDSRAQVLVSERSLASRFSEHGASLVLVDDNRGGAPAEEDRKTAARPQDLAYVIYTSGSTGRPKGVEISHGALVNFLWAMKDIPGVSPVDVVQSVTTICFDIAGLELWLPLIAGASVVVSSRETSLTPAALLASISRNGVTLLQATPATWRMLLDGGWKGTPQVKVLCGGEAMGLDLEERLLATGSEIWNMYGPTETTVWSTAGRVFSKRDSTFVGMAIANTQLYVTNSRARLQPIGVPGELLIGGDGLARGYLGREELTSERFITNPFAKDSRLYRTGDLVVRRANGAIEFLGRIDNQVKIRGYRIELGEIEARLEEHAGVKQCVVVAHEYGPGDKRLVAYLILERSDATDTATLRDYIQGKLPAYMVPSAFVLVSEFPMTPNGKVDRKQLPPPSAPSPSTAGGGIGVRHLTPHRVRTELAGIFEAVLKVPVPSFQDNFFDLGGHSLIALDVVNAINNRFGVTLSPTAMFELGSVEQLAVAIDDELTGGSGLEMGAESGASRHRSVRKEETEKVDAILDVVRSATRRARLDAETPRNMQEAPVCKHVLAPLYSEAPGSIREVLKRAILRVEQGTTFSVTFRKLLRKHHDIEIGDFTSCGLDPLRLRNGTRIGRFCSIHPTSMFQNADHPRNTLATHAVFYHRGLGFTSGYELERVQLEIGNDVWIGADAKILYPTRKIGDGAIVAAGSIVIGDVPPYAIVAGYPAQVVRYRFSKETIEKLLALRWWDKPLDELHAVREEFMKPLEGTRIR